MKFVKSNINTPSWEADTVPSFVSEGSLPYFQSRLMNHILSQLNPAHNLTFLILKLNFNITLPSMPTFSSVLILSFLVNVLY